MQLRKYRWSKDYESAEEELEALFAHKKITAEKWHAEEFEEFPAHSHGYDKQLWCAEGSIVFTVDDGSSQGKRISMQPGDALDLPSGTTHSAVAGFTGAVCYESHASKRPQP